MPVSLMLAVDDAYLWPYVRIQGNGRMARVVDLSTGNWSRGGSDPPFEAIETCEHNCDNTEYALGLDGFNASFPMFLGDGSGWMTFDVPGEALGYDAFLDFTFGRTDSDERVRFDIADEFGNVLATAVTNEYEDDMSPTETIVVPLAGLTSTTLNISYTGDDEGAIFIEPFLVMRMPWHFTTTTTSKATVNATTMQTSTTDAPEFTEGEVSGGARTTAPGAPGPRTPAIAAAIVAAVVAGLGGPP
mmetsp:Transcript_115381/g.358405  ORF Transcript_115381/g.358405 Transcript_115381/m.358405 type:complete len:245 (-) Transcript_115381:88-822(-)